MSETIDKLKRGISAYGRMLKSTYIPGHKKKQIRQSIASMEKEVKRLEAEERLENARLRVETTRSRLNKVKSSNKSGLVRWLTESPDYLGTGQGKRIGGGRRRSGKGMLGDVDLDFRW